MKRRMRTIVLFVLAGALANVAVAWGCAVRPGEHSTLHDIAGHWPRGVPQAWPAPNYTQRYVGLGWTLDNFHYFSPYADSAYVASASLFRAGWPVLALESADWVDHRTNILERSAGWDVGIYTGEYPELPLRPIWSGFAANTLFYGTTLCLLINGPLSLRRLARQRRGLCAACGYPMADSDVCTECGKQLRKRAVA